MVSANRGITSVLHFRSGHSMKITDLAGFSKPLTRLIEVVPQAAYREVTAINSEPSASPKGSTGSA